MGAQLFTYLPSPLHPPFPLIPVPLYFSVPPSPSPPPLILLGSGERCMLPNGFERIPAAKRIDVFLDPEGGSQKATLFVVVLLVVMFSKGPKIL